MSDEDANALLPGAHHYRAYVGPPAQYDLMGGTQFALLLTLGLREYHKLLDFGCGSLRAGRLLIPYLASGRYHGVEPNQWLIEDGLRTQLGSAIVDVKAPHFYAFDDFDVGRCGADFDFILAQSIFSHAGPELLAKALRCFKRSLGSDGLIVMTIIHSDRTGGIEDHSSGWWYPHTMSYAPERVQGMIDDAGLAGRAIPWHHPRQTWYLLAHRPDGLPPARYDAFLGGVILRTPDWRGSLPENE